MSIRLKRGLVLRLAVGLSVLAFPLVASGGAQASLAGALHSNFNLRPDLVSATIDPLQGPTGVDVCFDKTLNSLVAGANTHFRLVGYRAGNTSTAVTTPLPPFIDQTRTNCVIVNFSSTIDMTQYTALEVDANTVFANSGLNANDADSVALTGSTTHAGTTGVTTGPNLVGVLAPTGTNIATNSLTFVFDKAANVVDVTRFFYVTAGGQVCGSAATLAGNGTTTITIGFPACAGGTVSVAQAVRAGAFGKPTTAAVASVSDPSSTNPDESVVLPNAPNGGATQHPDLVSAAIGSDNDSIVYTFDRPVVVAPGGGVGTFRAELAVGGSPAISTGAVGSGTTTVTARFSGKLSSESEFGVIAWAFPNAVLDASNLANGNVPGSANIGDNAGAFGGGFTTGPEVFGITASKSTGVLTVNLDDRIAAGGVNPAGINLLDTNGSLIATATPTISFNNPNPGPSTITLGYPASALTNLGAVQFLQGALTEPAGTTAGVFAPVDAQNVQQIVAQVNTAAILKAYKAYKARHTHHKQHIKKHAR
jgi:hypothetical protein